MVCETMLQYAPCLDRAMSTMTVGTRLCHVVETKSLHPCFMDICEVYPQCRQDDRFSTAAVAWVERMVCAMDVDCMPWAKREVLGVLHSYWHAVQVHVYRSGHRVTVFDCVHVPH